MLTRVKSYSFLAITAVIAIALGSQYLYYTFTIVPNSLIPQKAGLHLDLFRLENSPIHSLSFNSEIRNHESLWDPEAAVPHTHNYEKTSIRQIYLLATKCIPSPVPLNLELKKAWDWHQYLCEATNKLPAHFFHTVPYIHPSGNSYVKLAYQSKRAEFATLSFLIRHKKLTHILELGWLQRLKVPLVAPEKILATFGPEDLQTIKKGKETVLNAHYIAFKDTHESLSPLYHVYTRHSWDASFDNSPLTPSPAQSNQSCAWMHANLCWQPSVSYEQRAKIFGILFVISITTLTLVLVVLLVMRWQHDSLVEKRRKFTFQLLTHEIRTPATTIQLLLENMREDFDQLPDKSQTAFLKLCGETQRLRGVVEASRQYLNACDWEKKASLVPSINAFFSDILEEFSKKISFLPLLQDTQAMLDGYWVTMCVKNLVLNALQHGKPPVEVILEIKGHTLNVHVRDAGQLALNLKELKNEKTKRNNTAGMGLGLNLVSTIARSLKGKLLLSHSPTQFTLQLGIVK